MKVFIFQHPSNFFEKTSNLLNQTIPYEDHIQVNKDYKFSIIKAKHPQHNRIRALYHIATLGLFYFLTKLCNSLTERKIRKKMAAGLPSLENLASKINRPAEQKVNEKDLIDDKHLLNRLPKDTYVMEIFKNLGFESMEQFSKLSSEFGSYKEEFIREQAIPTLLSELKSQFRNAEKGSENSWQCQLSIAYIEWKFKNIDPSKTIRSVKGELENDEVDALKKVSTLFILAQFEQELGQKDCEKTLKKIVELFPIIHSNKQIVLVQMMVPVLLEWENVAIEDIKKLLDLQPTSNLKIRYCLSLYERQNIKPTKFDLDLLEGYLVYQELPEEECYKAYKEILKNSSDPSKKVFEIKASIVKFAISRSKLELNPLFSGLFRAAIELNVSLDPIYQWLLELSLQKCTPHLIMTKDSIVACLAKEVSKYDQEKGIQILEQFGLSEFLTNLVQLEVNAKEQGNKEHLKAILEEIDRGNCLSDPKDCFKLAKVAPNPEKYLDLAEKALSGYAMSPFRFSYMRLLIIETTRLLGLNAGLKKAKQFGEEQDAAKVLTNIDKPFSNILISLLNMYTNEVKKQTQKDVLDVCEMISSDLLCV